MIAVRDRKPGRRPPTSWDTQTVTVAVLTVLAKLIALYDLVLFCVGVI